MHASRFVTKLKDLFLGAAERLRAGGSRDLSGASPLSS